MNNQIDQRQKAKRSERLKKLGNSLRDDFINSRLGKRLQVVCERIDSENMLFSGTSGEYIKVYFRTEKDFDRIHGKLIRLKSSKRYQDGLWAEEL